jgi:predicted metalloendopeptidase
MVDDAANRQRQLQPALNSITIPAAILQPPFFNVKAEDAVNYGLLGITFGHEISHAFDDSGSQYDAHGRLRNWWTAEDRAAFKRARPAWSSSTAPTARCRAITSTAN